MPKMVIPPFTAPLGRTLFLAQGDLAAIRILGTNGTEAVVPLADIGAFLEYLERIFLDPASHSSASE